MAASKAEILEALALLASKAEGGVLEKKPNVDEFKDSIGDISAADRDEAWDEYTESLKAEAEKARVAEEEIAAAKAEAVSKGAPSVKNNCRNSITINGVDIAAGASANVQGFDPEHKVMQAWLEAKVIEIV